MAQLGLHGPAIATATTGARRPHAAAEGIGAVTAVGAVADARPLAAAATDGLQQDRLAVVALGEHGEVAAALLAELHLPAVGAGASSTAHAVVGAGAIRGVCTGCGVGDRASGTTTTTHRLQEDADRLVAGGLHRASQLGRDSPAVATLAAATSTAGVQAHAEGGVGFSGAGCGARGDGAALTTTATDGLEKDAVGDVAGGEDDTIRIQRHVACTGTGSTRSAHRE